MSSFELNKIFAAVLCAGITVMLAGFVADKIIHSPKLEKDAVTVEGEADDHGGGASDAGPAGPEPILALIAAADVEKGAKISAACAACHSFDKGGATKQGPALWGIVGHAKATHEGFDYSEGMKAKGGTWTYEDLNHFLWKPKKFVDGTKMNFIGLKKPEDRAAMIAWLRAQADSPAALPTEAEIAAEAAALAPPAPAEGAAPAADGTAPAATEGASVPTEEKAEDKKEAATETAAEGKEPPPEEPSKGQAEEPKEPTSHH